MITQRFLKLKHLSSQVKQIEQISNKVPASPKRLTSELENVRAKMIDLQSFVVDQIYIQQNMQM